VDTLAVPGETRLRDRPDGWLEKLRELRTLAFVNRARSKSGDGTKVKRPKRTKEPRDLMALMTPSMKRAFLKGLETSGTHT
jgi:hypothetical protein